MGELGPESDRGHRDVGEAAAQLRIDELIAVGPTGVLMAEAARKAGLEKSSAVNSPAEAAELLGKSAGPGDLILIKGSRSARMERVLEEFARAEEVAP
jgi:UDP-N-acetylmuramoyl-tripeptide--D-alanyl-D-alanine ligase